jgi:uncharacterized pyridoxal phosphate-containing UPF0001 family protein
MCRKASTRSANCRHWNLDWHFIGPLQSNKTRPVAEFRLGAFDRSPEIAERLSSNARSRCRRSGLPAGQCQRRGQQERRVAAGSGCLRRRLPRCRIFAARPDGIPEPVEDFRGAARPFRLLRELYEQLKQEGLPLDTLSMGMSHDLEAAIAEGATHGARGHRNFW